MWPREEDCRLCQSAADPNAVAWSEDNLLAVICGAAAMILDPRDLRGSKVITAPSSANFSHLDVKAIPDNGAQNFHFSSNISSQLVAGNRSGGHAVVRHISWSPTGCSATGGCILATITSDHRVRLFARPETSAYEWSCFADITELLAAHLESTNWAAARKIADDAGVPRAQSKNRGSSLQPKDSGKGKNPEEGQAGQDGQPVNPAAQESEQQAREPENPSPPLKRRKVDKQEKSASDQQKPAKKRPSSAAKPRDSSAVKQSKNGPHEESPENQATQNAAPGGTPSAQQKIGPPGGSAQQPGVSPPCKEGSLFAVGSSVEAASQEKGSKQAWFPLSKHSSRESLGDGEAAEVLDSDSCSIRPAPPRKVIDLSAYKEGQLVDVLHKRAWWQAVVVSQNRRNATVLIFATGAKRTSTAADMRRTLVWEKERFQALEGPQLSGDRATTSQGKPSPQPMSPGVNQPSKGAFIPQVDGASALPEGSDAETESLAGVSRDTESAQEAAQQPKPASHREPSGQAGVAASGVAAPTRVRLGTLSPKGFSFKKVTLAKKEGNKSAASKASGKETSQQMQGKPEGGKAGRKQSDDRPPPERLKKLQKIEADQSGGIQASKAEGSPEKEGPHQQKPEMSAANSSVKSPGNKSAEAQPQGTGEQPAKQPKKKPVKKKPETEKPEKDKPVKEKPMKEKLVKEKPVKEKLVKKPSKKPVEPPKALPAKKAQKASKKVKAPAPQSSLPAGETELPSRSTEPPLKAQEATEEIDEAASEPEESSESSEDLSDEQSDAEDSDSHSESARKRKEPTKDDAASNEEAARTGRKPRKRQRRFRNQPSIYIPQEEYKVPADFDPSILAPVDVSNRRGFNTSFPYSFLDRWLELRSQVDPEKVPTYTKGAHMRGPDILIYEQTQAEFRHAFGDDMDRLGVTLKWMHTECKRVIRTMFINPPPRTGGSPNEEDMIDRGDGKGKCPMTETELALKFFRNKRGERTVKAARIVQEGDLQKRKARGLARAVAVGFNGADQPSIPALEYEARLDLMKPTCMSWSPPSLPSQPGTGDPQGTPASSTGTVLLAIGTKAGCTWLWKYSKPTLSCRPQPRAESAALSLVGSLPGPMASVTALSWVKHQPIGSLTLCVAFSDGSIRLHKLSQEHLHGLSQSQEMCGLETSLACPPDLKAVTAMDAVTLGISGIGIVAGKQNGSLIVWTAQGQWPDSKGGRGGADQKAELIAVQNAHGTLSLTSVKWLQDPKLEGDRVSRHLASSGLDNQICSWRLFDSKVELETKLPPPQDVKTVGLIQTHRPYGLATSQNRLVAAVLREISNAALESLKDVMIHKKLLRSRLLFHPLTELNPSLDPAPVIAASIEACLGCETLQMGHVWDVAALLFKLGAREADTETDEAASLGRNQLGPAACTALLTQEILNSLEAGAHSFEPSETSSEPLARPGLLGNLGLDRGAKKLRIANALRRLLDPYPLQIQASGQYLPMDLPDKSEYSLEWNTRIRDNEFLLLQLHIFDTVQASVSLGVSKNRLSRLLMADWLSLFSQRTQPELTQCCKQAYSSLDMQQPSSGERRPPCRESEAGVDVLLDSETHPVAAARSGLLSVQGSRITLPRCAASMELLKGGAHWCCRLCKRSYSSDVMERRLLKGLSCLFCGIRLTPSRAALEQSATIPTQA